MKSTELRLLGIPIQAKVESSIDNQFTFIIENLNAK